MLLDRGVEVDNTTIFRWIQAYAVELEKPLRPHLRTSNGSWRVDETYVKVKGRWMYLYRAVDSRGQTIEQHRRARSSAGEAINRPRAWLRWFLDGPTNAGRIRGDGDDQKGAGSEHQRRRHQSP